MTKILTLDRMWNPHQWISLEEAMILEAKELVLDRLGTAVYMYRGGVNAKTGERSKLETSTIIVVDGVAAHRKYREPALTNAALFQRDRCVCAYCGGKFKSSELTRDHIVPQSKGGPDRWMNVVASCKQCNLLKADTLPGSKLKHGVLGPQGTGKMDPLYVPYVPCKAEMMILRELRDRGSRILFDQMEFLVQQVKNPTSRVRQDMQKLIEARKSSGTTENSVIQL